MSSNKVVCPECRNVVTPPDSVSPGQRIECPRCHEAFLMPGTAPPAKAAVQEQRRLRPTADPVERPAPVRRRPVRDDFDDEDDRPAAKPRKTASGEGLLIGLLLGGGALLLLTCAGGGLALWYFWPSPSPQVAQQAQPAQPPAPVAPANPGPRPGPAVQNPMAPQPPANLVVEIHVHGQMDDNQKQVLLKRLPELADAGARLEVILDGRILRVSPVRDPAAYAKKLADLGDVRGQAGNLIVLVPHRRPGAGAAAKAEDDVAQALEDLKSRDHFTRRRGAEALAKVQPNQRQAEVARALEEALEIKDVFNPHTEILKALEVWGTKETTVPILIRLLKHEDLRTRREAMQAVAKFKDERAAEPLAENLAEQRYRLYAARALQEMGPVAEKAVKKYLNHQDRLVRREACQILGAVGTRDSLADLKALAQAADGTVKSAANDAVAAIERRHPQ